MTGGVIPKLRAVSVLPDQSAVSLDTNAGALQDNSHDVHISALPGRVRNTYLKTESQFEDELITTGSNNTLVALKQTASVEKTVKHFRGLIRCNEHGIFYIFHGSHWERDENAGAALLTRAIAKGLSAIGGASMSYVDNVIKALRKDGRFKLHPEPEKVVPFENGLLDLKSKDLITPTPDTAARYFLPYQYTEEGNCETIMMFLKEQTPAGCDKVLIFYLAGALRELLLQRLIVLVGQGGTGKSVLGNLIIKIFGPRNVVTTDMAIIEGSNNRFETGILEGKRFCLMLDQPPLPKNKPFNIIKKMTGGDMIRAEIKNGGVYNYQYKGGLVITCNQGIGGKTDSGMDRRALVIPMNKKPEVADPDFLEKLSAEIPIFVRYLSEFTDEEIREGLRQDNLPSAIIEANQDATEQSNVVLAWAKVALTPCDYNTDPDCFAAIGNYTPAEGLNGPITDRITQIKTKMELDGEKTFLFPSYHLYCHRNNINYVLPVGDFVKQLLEVTHQLNMNVTKKNDSKTNRQTIYGIKLKPLMEMEQ